MDGDRNQTADDKGMQALFLAIVIGGALFVLGTRLWLGRDLPLWLDESWTGMIVSQPDLTSLWREIWLDVNAPLYYQMMWLWTTIAGNSNIALRLPSLLLTVGAAAVPLIWRLDGLSRNARIGWAAMLLLWAPANIVSIDARSYALLLFLITLLTLSFASLIAKPTGRHFHLWCMLGALAIAAHYFAAFVVAAQGLMLLWREPRATVRNWPAFFWYAPILGWLAYHLPRLLVYSQPGISWYPPLDLDKASAFLSYALGQDNGVQLAIVAIVSAIMLSSFCRSPVATGGNRLPLMLAATSGLLALAIMVIFDAFKPSFTPRYMTVIAPMALLGLVLIASSTRRPTLALALMVGLSLAPSLALSTTRSALIGRSLFGFEAEALRLAATHPDRVIFTWDGAGTRVLDLDTLGKLGGFFIYRTGQRPEIAPVIVYKGESPDVRLLQQIGAKPSALLWIYNHDGDAPYWAASTRAHFRDWRCREEDRGSFTILNCPKAFIAR
jgi:uncharacterized membrane protein